MPNVFKRRIKKEEKLQPRSACSGRGTRTSDANASRLRGVKERMEGPLPMLMHARVSAEIRNVPILLGKDDGKILV